MSMHIFHKWAPYSGIIVGQAGRLTQWRRCKSCGHIQHRVEGYAQGVDVEAVNEAVMPPGQEVTSDT